MRGGVDPDRVCGLFPFGPLERQVILSLDMPRASAGNEPGWTAETVAQALDVPRRSVYRWRRDGLSIVTADRLACRLGLHPALIWTDWYAVAA